MIRKLLASALVLIFFQSAYAYTPPEPEACPTIADLQKAGVSYASSSNNEYWTGIEWINKFGTTVDWTFMVQFVAADNPTDALAKANAAIALLSLQGGPEYDDGNKVWGCMYANFDMNQDNPPKDKPLYTAFAMTPAMPYQGNELMNLLREKTRLYRAKSKK